MTDDLLRAKSNVQKQLDEEACHDMERYVENARKIVREAEEEHGLTFKYGTPSGDRTSASPAAEKATG